MRNKTAVAICDTGSNYKSQAVIINEGKNAPDNAPETAHTAQKTAPRYLLPIKEKPLKTLCIRSEE